MLKAFGANPTTMAFGDVPPALETGVIDGLLTSLGGFNQVKEQAPFFSIAGINGIVGDYYYIAAANKWWNKLKPEHQQIIEKIVTGKIENEDCAASYGEYTVAVRYRKNDEVFDDEYPGSWERTGDQPYLFEGRYPIGENADLVRVRARKIQCICGERAVDDADPVDEGEPE